MAFFEKGPLKAIARKYSLNAKDERYFDILWELFQIASKYKEQHKRQINRDLGFNYTRLAAAILDVDSLNLRVSITGTVNHMNIDIPERGKVFSRVKTIPYEGRLPSDKRRKSRRDDLRIHQPRHSKFVIFSDHHITHSGHRHDYFARWNKELYKEILNWYADNDYGLIENGDVEEYTIFEPDTTNTAKYERLIQKKKVLGVREDVGSIDWDDLIELRTQERIKILERILNDHSDLYEIITSRFASRGRRYYTRITGNHDPYISEDLIALLPDGISNNLADALRMLNRNDREEVLDEPKYFITHGHQFDASTLPQHSTRIGETISESLGWTIQGADRIWSKQKTNQWRNPDSPASFRNILAKATSGVGFSLSPIAHLHMISELTAEAVMRNHEIAWEYFDEDNPTDAITNEVLTGNEYFKVRHLSETKLVNKMEFLWRNTDIRNFTEKPKVIIGHTHEPRKNAKKSTTSNRIARNYLNTGSAGRFAKLIWGVELVNGKETVVSWTKVRRRLIRNAWLPNKSGTLVRSEYPLSLEDDSPTRKAKRVYKVS